ncbi:ER-golgi trafficking TRAPP I complex 85 kDa subunit-domain-containing protein [Clohesyomyces aquaticus]|uniref:ER-golgi trafficking TRAPP I complex 85 kDa subunit-domain-containing protein n=1 Tax=Clohesyomyces aquaticus TaxID=1231657 RepID=A0A1Y1ZHA6_9PLEO|nr:ER-golgi trafficking TRAPP I complex 85 kDa subunit-domain-containing protein [Clohesyomyces aquaticus]
MNPLQDATPRPPKYPADLDASMILPKQRASPASSLASLPYRRSNPSLQKLFQSTASISGSRPSSGTATPTPSTVPGSVFSPGGSTQNGTGTPGGLPPGVTDEHRNLIQRAFVPHVAVLADEATEEMLRGKGLEGGLLQLLRPFGELVPGKVTIRDSVGAGRSHEDFGIRFVGVRDGLVPPTAPGRNPELRVETAPGQLQGRAQSQARGQSQVRGLSSGIPRPQRTGGHVPQIEELVDRHLQYSEFNSHDMVPDYMNHKEEPAQSDVSSSPFHTLYLRRLLSGLPVVSHETFAHPVACVIAVSSRHPNPTEEIRKLYSLQHDGELRMPQFVENDYLRYYVLVHDEETGDIAHSNQTFESMKRHFGFHCHLLRLKSQQCIPSDDDSVRLPTCEWMSATEELAEIQKRETSDDITDPTPYLPDSDITAIRTFVRELVVQSVVPNMERKTALWNEQVLARRRGLSGRFMSLSKRWTPFGSSSRNSSSPAVGSSSNYDSLGEFYTPSAPEAVMRKLADYSFMLRDFKLALSTYDILRTDFNNDKAWRHYAGAAEMAAISALLAPGPLSSKSRTENVDSWIEAAAYSYTDRQLKPTPYFALRTLALGLELLRLRGSSAADDAARWAARILEMGIVGPVGHALFTERVSSCYAIRTGVGALALGSRRRKAAFWAVLAAENWVRKGNAVQSERCLDSALPLYGVNVESVVPTATATTSASMGMATMSMGKSLTATLPFPQMQAFIDELRQAILSLRLQNRGIGFHGDGDEEGEFDTETINAGSEKGLERSLLVEEATETLDKSPRSHRKSLIGASAPQPIDVGPRSPMLERGEALKMDDRFE